MPHAFSGSSAIAPNGRLRIDPTGTPPASNPADLFALLALMQGLQQQVDVLKAREQQLELQCRVQEEALQQAARMQRDMLPAPIEFAGVDLHTLFRPTDLVSGDFYDVLPLDENRVAICLADVSGHGVSAGLLTPLLKRCFAAAGEDYDPAKVLTHANDALISLGLKQGEFVTALCAIYDRKTRTLTYARAGAPHPILTRAGQPTRQLTAPGALLGAIEGMSYSHQTVQLQPGDTVYIHTDGLEALLVEGTGTGTKTGRCDDLTATPWYASLESMTAEEVLDDVDFRLIQTDPQSWPADDLTAVALHIPA